MIAGIALAPSRAPASLTRLGRVADRGRAMGGRLEVHIAAESYRQSEAAGDAARVAARIRAWAAALTRHDPSSDLMTLNADPRPAVPVGPGLGAALWAAADAAEETGNIVDVTLLDARLAVEAGLEPTCVQHDRRSWALSVGDRPGRAVVHREPGVHLDLGGVGKGWLADRALGLLRRYPGALIDADGDLAIRVAPGDRWDVGVGDPRDDDKVLAVFALPGRRFQGDSQARYGLATSGTSVHRWGPPQAARHHLIDPRTGRPAVTDVVQATVLARSARSAEALAKAVVILGAVTGLDLLDRAGALGAVLLLDDDRSVALPRTERYLA